MLVHRVKEFIQSVSKLTDRLDQFDKDFLAELLDKFDNLMYLDVVCLEKADLEWFAQLFARRWQNIADDENNDYTFGPTDVNAPWDALARDLMPDLKKFYLFILMPTLTNEIDPNNLSRLSNAPDARSIFISNNNTWHRLLALYEELQKPSGVFGVLDKPKNIRPRALTLDDLYRIRSKRGGEELVFKAKNGLWYSNFWHYLIQEILPSLHSSKNYPTHLLPSLLKLIEKYFDMKAKNADLESFQLLFNCFKNELLDCSLSEVNNFYGTRVNGNLFLLEILLDCMKNNSENLEDKLFKVARWICQRDPSLISLHKRLRSIYSDLNAGVYFNLNFLRQLVDKLNITSSSRIKPLQTDLSNYLKIVIEAELDENREVRFQLVNKIKLMYSLRGKKIIDSPIDYTRMQNGVNFQWVHLAQYLARAGLIEANYYRLLIPTLRDDTDPVTYECLTKYPLYKYILSNSAQELIYLPNCVTHHKINGTFYNCNEEEPTPLTYTEKKRLAFADPEIYDYFLRINKKYEDPPISKRTIDEIQKLVNGSLNPSGLWNAQISAAQYSHATSSYDDFLMYINELSDEERNNLLKQKILLHAYQITVQEIFDLIQSKNYKRRECIAVHGKYLSKLVIDYAPNTVFALEIERKVDIASMRATSAKKVYSDYSELTERDARKRILIVFTSLLTHSFQYIWLTGESINFGEHNNKVTETGKEIFDWLKTAILRNDFKHARFLYGQLLEYIIKPSLNNKSWFRYPDTEDWFTSIINSSLFNPQNREFFDPELILKVLWPWIKSNSRIKPLIENLFDEIFELLKDTENTYKKWILINIAFKKFIDNQSIDLNRAQIFTEFRANEESNPEVNPEEVFQICKEYLIHQVAQFGARQANYRQPTVFGISPGYYTTTYEHITLLLNEELDIIVPTERIEFFSIQELLKKFHEILGVNRKRELIKIGRYLRELYPELLVTDTTLDNLENTVMTA